MKEYEYRRNTFYQLNAMSEWPDNHANFDITVCDDKSEIIKDAVMYLTEGKNHTNFPGAARAVAVAVSYFITENFNENLFEVLNDPNLMHGNDPYFVPYEDDKDVYNAIIEQVDGRINWDTYRMNITKNLINQEYMLDEDGLSVLPRWNND